MGAEPELNLGQEMESGRERPTAGSEFLGCGEAGERGDGMVAGGPQTVLAIQEAGPGVQALATLRFVIHLCRELLTQAVVDAACPGKRLIGASRILLIG